MANPFTSRVQNKLVACFLPCVILPILITAAVISWTNYMYFRKTIEQTYRNIATRSAGEINLYLETARKDLESLAWLLSSAIENKQLSSHVMTTFLFSKPQLSKLILATSNGRMIRVPEKAPLPEETKWRHAVETAMQGKESVWLPLQTADTPFWFFVSVPVKRQGQADAALCGVFHLKPISDVLEGIRIGHSGKVNIFDLSNEADIFQMMGRDMNTGALNATVRIKSSPDAIFWYTQQNGQVLYCAGAYLPEMNGAVVLSQPVSEIHRYLLANIGWAGAISTASCILTTLLGLTLIGKVIQPIKILSAQVRRMQKGEFGRKVTITTGDEIGELSKAFNEMSGSLEQHIEKEVERAKEIVHNRNLAALGTASSKVAHEVGNLLNNLGLTVKTCRKEPMSKGGLQALDILDEQSRSLRRFIDTFLRFSKKPELHLQRCPLGLMVREISETHSRQNPASHIKFHVDWPADLPEIVADPHLMHQALNNLVKNSVEALSGKDHGSIRITGFSENHCLGMAIEDTGSGMDPETRERAFDPFFTANKAQGNGLGLSIVRTIVEAHGGTIACSSEKGRHTRFTIRLPRRDETQTV